MDPNYGYANQLSSFDDDFQQLGLGAKRPEATFVMDLLPGVVGWIIGRSGTRIKEIQLQSGCKMWVDQDVPDDQPRKLFFHGSAQGIECAVNLVNKLLLAAPNLAGKHGAIKKLYSNIVDCPADLVGLLIGKKGWTIKKIQLESGAQISINQSVREGQPRKIIVSGMQASVELATRLIEEVLRNKPEEDDLSEQLLLSAMNLNGRVLGADALGMHAQTPFSGGGGGSIYTASGLLSSDFGSSSSGLSGGLMWEDEVSRQATLVRGNEALFLQSHPSLLHTQRGFQASSPRARNSAGSAAFFPSEQRRESFADSAQGDAIFDTRRRSDSEPPEKLENLAMPSGMGASGGVYPGLGMHEREDSRQQQQQQQHQHQQSRDEDEEYFPPARRGSTGSLNPNYLRDGLGMGFGTTASDAPSTLTYTYQDYRPPSSVDAEDTIARQLQLKALQKQRVLQLQQQQKEKQLAALKMHSFHVQQMRLQEQQQQQQRYQQEQQTQFTPFLHSTHRAQGQQYGSADDRMSQYGVQQSVAGLGQLHMLASQSQRASSPQGQQSMSIAGQPLGLGLPLSSPITMAPTPYGADLLGQQQQVGGYSVLGLGGLQANLAPALPFSQSGAGQPPPFSVSPPRKYGADEQSLFN